MEPHCNWFTSKYDDVEDLLVSISNCNLRNRIGNVGLQQHNMPDYAQAPKYAATNSTQHPHLSGSRTSHCDGAVQQLAVQSSVSLRTRLGVNLRATVQCGKICPMNSSPFPPGAGRQSDGGGAANHVFSNSTPTDRLQPLDRNPHSCVWTHHLTKRHLVPFPFWLSCTSIAFMIR